MKFIESLRDLWYVKIVKLHKHNYKRISDAGFLLTEVGGNGSRFISHQRHQCTGCKKIVGLDDWQVQNLPTKMKYEKLTKIKIETWKEK